MLYITEIICNIHKIFNHLNHGQPFMLVTVKFGKMPSLTPVKCVRDIFQKCTPTRISRCVA